MIKKYFLIFAIIFLIINVSALTVERDTSIDLSHPIRIDDFPSDSIHCNISLFDPDNIELIDFQPMTNQFEKHNYTVDATNNSKLGTYNYDITCTTGLSNKTESFDYEVTPTGEVLTTAKGMIYILLAILVFLLFSFVLYINIALPMGNEKNNRGQTTKIIKKKYIKIALIPVTYSLFVWFLNLLLSISNNLTGKFNIYYGMFNFLFLFFLRLSWVVWVVCLVWFMFIWIRDLHWNKQIKKFGRVIR